MTEIIKWRPVETVKWRMWVFVPKISLRNINRHSLTIEDSDARMIEQTVSDHVVSGLGESSVVIFDPMEFLARTKAEAKRQGSRFYRGLVEDKDLAKNIGDIGPKNDTW